MISITIDNLVKKFDRHVALDGISCRVEPGEIFFLLGPSGCGKTTLLRNIAGFLIPDSGRVLFDTDDVTKLPPWKRNTGMMFQSYALWPHMTVTQNVAFGLEERRLPRKEIAERTAEALASVKMSDYAERKIAQLSGGQQQRVALARALVIRPRALLLDEPLSNLDAKLRLEMRTEIRRVCKEFGLTAIYVTHDQKEALSISDRMAILHAGRTEQIGRPEEIYRSPRTRVVADFIGETNFIPATLRSLDSATAIVECALGIFEGTVSDPNWRPAIGEAVMLSIRPEAWKFSPKKNPTTPSSGGAGTNGTYRTFGTSGNTLNTCHGHLATSQYLGEVAQYQIAFENGGLGDTLLKAFELNPRPSSRPDGMDISLSVAPEDVIVLR